MELIQASPGQRAGRTAAHLPRERAHQRPDRV